MLFSSFLVLFSQFNLILFCFYMHVCFAFGVYYSL